MAAVSVIAILLVGAGFLVRWMLREASSTCRGLSQANLAKARFLRLLAERIRQPLSDLVGITNLLTQSNLSQSQLEYAEIARQSSQSLLLTLNDLLEYARLDDGTIQPQNTEFDLHGLLEDVSEQFAQLACAKKLTLNCCIAPDVPAVVNGDAVLLSRLLRSLLSNAVKFTGKGEVVLTARLLQGQPSMYTICFDVADTGIGIPEATQARLLRRNVDGSEAGIGLPIAQLIANRFRGTLDFYSEVGKGSTFWSVLQFGKPRTVIAHNSVPPRRCAVFARNESTRRMVLWKLATLGIRATSIGLGERCPEGLDVVFTECNPPPLPSAVQIIWLVREAQDAPPGFCHLLLPLRLSAMSSALIAIHPENATTTQIAGLAQILASHQPLPPRKPLPT